MSPGAARGRSALRLFPAVTLALFLAPVAAGLVATALPAFGYLPALGRHGPSLEPWLRLLATPGLATSVRLTLQTGLLATVLALAIVIGFCSTMHATRLFRRTQAVLAPLLATPHVAVAIGLSFLIAPGGWIARLLSPWLTGWTRPPDVAVVHDASGLSFVLGRLLKGTNAFIRGLGYDPARVGFWKDMFTEEHSGLFSALNGEKTYGFHRSGFGREEQELALYMAAQREPENKFLQKYMQTSRYNGIGGEGGAGNEKFQKDYEYYLAPQPYSAMPDELRDKIYAVFNRILIGGG